MSSAAATTASATASTSVPSPFHPGWSFTHMDDVAAATAKAIEGVPAGIYNIVDDEPAEVSIWLPELARILGAKPPRHVPTWIARLLIGDAGVSMMTATRGSSNEKAKRVFDSSPSTRAGAPASVMIWSSTPPTPTRPIQGAGRTAEHLLEAQCRR
jgi:nucleoside-diphosphate-sugar epimerase